MTLRTLGGLSLKGASLPPKPLLLLAFLALEGAQERRHLAGLFFQDTKRPLKNLSVVLTRIKQAAPGAVHIGKVRISTEVRTDSHELIELLDAGQLVRGVELYQGRFLEGVYVRGWGSELEEWVIGTGEFIARRVREALLGLSEREAVLGKFHDAVKQAERAYLLAGAPALEPEELQRFYTLFVAGGSHRAVEVREEALDVGLSLMVSAEEARDRLRSLHDTRENRPSLRDLPKHKTAFVGRKRELDSVTELLSQPECQLLSLVGAGGEGKTRLALEVAQQQLEVGGFADGVVFVPLEALTHAASIPAVVVDAFGLTLAGQEDTRSVVLWYLADKQLLLVLDNFEHLLEGTAFVGELFDRCPRLKLLVTSRERLGLEHEWVFPVEGLSYPEEGTPLEQAESFDAVRLFVERARRVQPSFSPTPEVLPAVVRITQLVGGMPLAIELAASWLRALPVSEIAAELESGMDLLVSSSRDVSERHRGVRVVFDHSWALLTEDERRGLRRLSVFRGGFNRKAASDIAGVTLPGLAGLVDKSFLGMGPEGRYDWHPLLSQYTREKLAELPGERAEVEQKHGSHYLGLVRELEPDLWTLERKQALRVFVKELANIRAAWSWAIENLDLEEVERTTPAMFDFLESRHEDGFEYFGTPVEFFGSVAERLDEDTPDHAGALGSALVHQALPPLGFHRQSLSPRRRSQAGRGIELLESLGEPRALARGFEALGSSLIHERELAQADEAARKALALARKRSHANDIARALRVLSFVRWDMIREGTLSLALQAEFVRESLQEVRALSHQPGVANFLLESGLALELERRFEKAKERYWQTNRLADELGHYDLVVRSHVFLADMSFDLGEFDRAAAQAEKAYRRAEESGLLGWMYWSLGPVGRAATAHGKFERAREVLVRGMKEMLARGQGGSFDKMLMYWAELLAAEGNPGDAVSLMAHFEGRDPDRLLSNQVLAKLERSMAPEEYATAMERGRGMTRDEVVREFVPELSR